MRETLIACALWLALAIPSFTGLYFIMCYFMEKDIRKNYEKHFGRKLDGR